MNQSQKHIKAGTAALAYVGADAEPKLVSHIRDLCEENGVAFDESHTMAELGTLCGIDVDCAVCVVLK
ncbi:MAG: ribosomal L7Ae/L30e/S12e/Gadd45 family protein [Ruminococcus sp.]|nr:ribosomal L7Ae/L30e/S12e/Gadd45 family protein [Candidatus Apopatosoma intestinale]